MGNPQSSRARLAAACALGLLAFAAAEAQAQRYRVTLSPSAAFGLNSTGQTTGSRGSFQGAFLSGPNNASPASIGSINCAPPGDPASDCQFNFGFGVNDAGVVVGVGQHSSAGGYAFYSGNNGVGLTRVIGTGPAATRFRAVNNAGQATGYVEEGPNPFVGTRFAVLYDIAGQSYAKLTIGAGEGLALNATGAVGGGGPQAGFNGQFAFVTGDNGAGIAWLPRPEGDDFMEVTGINDLGHYVGYSGVFSNGAFLPFVDFGGGISFAAIAPLAGNNNHRALAVNNAGTVVGTSGGRGFVWDAVRGTRDLRTLVIPGTGADNCGQATALNQRGQILCDGNLLTPLSVPSDFDGDGRSDIFWRNASTGENYVYPMNGLAILGTEGYVRTVADQNWQVAGIGDFDGDGRADVLWRNAATGENYVYLMNGTAIAGEGYLRTVADQDWQVAGVGDFNGDGNADILWRNSSSGENYLYPMSGLAILGTEGYLRTVADLNWNVAGVADLDGDGKSDVVWRNAATGENYLYPMNGTAILAAEGYIRTVADQNWKIVGTGDFNGDGKGDILWRNAVTGENYLYPMNGKTILGTEGYLRTVPDQDWRVQATGDYDGDGKADILWRNSSSGENYLYFMNGTTILGSEGYIRTVADLNWAVATGSAAPAPVQPTSLGTDFYLTFPDHLCVSEPGSCPGAATVSLLVTSASNNSGTVTFPGGSVPFNLLAGGQSVIPLPTGVVLTSNESVEAKAVRVTAVNPVAVHAMIESEFLADGYLALPAAQLGTSYVVVSHAHANASLPGSLFAIVGTQDGTDVTITPSAAGATRPAGTPFQASLDAGQTYQLLNPGTGDMTGSTVVASKPVAVFGGHRCVSIPSGTGFCDNLVEQIPDVSRVGHQYRVLPLDSRPDYALRIVGVVDGTALAYNPPVPGACASVEAGQVCEVLLTGKVEVVTQDAAHPILVAQYMRGSQSGGEPVGDPAMGLVTPQAQALTEMRFSVHGLGAATKSPFVNIVTPTAALGALTLDGAAVNPGLFAQIGTTAYSGGAVPVAAGAHVLGGGAPFTAMVYQAGVNSSYLYPAASGLAVVNP